MVLAVLEAHCGVRLSGHDVYLNVAGGLRVDDRRPISPPPPRSSPRSPMRRCRRMRYLFGEVSLSGAVRPVAQVAARLKEADKLGFARAVIPAAARAEGDSGLTLEGVGALSTLVADIAARGTRTQRQRSPLSETIERARLPSGIFLKLGRYLAKVLQASNGASPRVS